MPFKSIDWDYWLEYSTVKTVRIRDKRLGLLHLCLLISGVGVGIFYVFFVAKAYLRYDNAEGSVRFRLYTPPYQSSIQSASYCNANCSVAMDFERCNCRVLDSLDLVFPEKEESAAFIAFHIEEYDEYQMGMKELCDSNGVCRMNHVWGNSSSSIYYPLNPEMFLIDLNHQAFFPTFVREEIDDQGYKYQDQGHGGSRWVKDSSSLWGQLVDPVTDTSLFDSPIGSGSRDRFPISLLLKATNISADEIRAQGALVRMAINYGDCEAMIRHDTPAEVARCVSAQKLGVLNSYRYLPFKIPSPHTHVYRTIYHSDGTRTVQRMTGLRLVFWVTGRAGQFGVAELLIALASVSTVITVVSVLVDKTAIWLMPQRDLYSKAKYASTKPFTKIRRTSLYDRLRHPAGHGGHGHGHGHEHAHEPVAQEPAADANDDPPNGAGSGSGSSSNAAYVELRE